MSRRKQIGLSSAVLIPLVSLYWLQTREDPNLRKLDEILATAKANTPIDGTSVRDQRPQSASPEMVQIDLLVVLVPSLGPSSKDFLPHGFLADTPEVLRLLQEHRRAEKVQVVPAPTLVVESGKSCNVRSSDSLPVTCTTTGKTNFWPVGLAFDCTPTVGGNGVIDVDLGLEHRELDPNNGLPGVPGFSSRGMRSGWRGQDGKTLFIRGLIQKGNLQRVVNIPLLSDAPWIGPAFTYTSTTKVDGEALVLVTPRRIKASK